MPLFDLSAHKVRLPANVTAYASGSNRVSEIRGFARLGIPIGVSVPHLRNKGIRTQAPKASFPRRRYVAG